MFFPQQVFGPLFFILPAALLAALFVALMILLVAVVGRRSPDPLGRRAEAAYLFSTIFAIGLLGLGALAMTADAIGTGVSGGARCDALFDEGYREEIVTPPPGASLRPFPQFTAPSFEDFFPDFQFTFEPVPSPSPASLEIRPQPTFCRPGRAATARGIHAAMYLGAAAIGVVWFGNRARELLAKETSDDS